MSVACRSGTGRIRSYAWFDSARISHLVRTIKHEVRALVLGKPSRGMIGGTR